MTSANKTNHELDDAELEHVVGGNTTLQHEVVHASNTSGTVILGLRKSGGGSVSGMFF
jgi:hypothetical protein